jgi:hypothetical protein
MRGIIPNGWRVVSLRSELSQVPALVAEQATSGQLLRSNPKALDSIFILRYVIVS